MKKIIALMLCLVLVLSFAACTDTEAEPTDTASETVAGTVENTDAGTEDDGAVTVMTYAEYAAAEIDAEVVIEAYVQATQSWWDNKITVYTQDQDGAYFIYELACSEEDSAKLTKGTKIRVSGVKSVWSGEIEITDATFEFVDAEPWVAEATDVTELLANEEELIKHQNKFVVFNGLTVEEISYKNGEPGDDIYVTLSKDGASYSFCVERYLTGPETEVYTAVGELAAGDVVTVEGFLYWYEGVNTHITAVSKAA